MIYLLVGILVAYLIYVWYTTLNCINPQNGGSSHDNFNLGFPIFGSIASINDPVKASTCEEDLEKELTCQTRDNLFDLGAGNNCKIGDGLNILTYLGLGPADQDQLNLMNHKDHNNLAWILRRPLNPPRKLINNLKESNTGPLTGPFAADSFGKVDFKTWNPCKCDVGIVNLDRPPTELEGVTKAVAERLVDCKTHDILYNLSPDFLRTDLKQYYGGLYYNDVRYPERPIGIEFAKDPAGYCMRHPQEYPCPLIASRKDIR
ncbi:MAG: hypothetical protein WD512_11800 [Candidatus Paceibacterota bacterium]